MKFKVQSANSYTVFNLVMESNNTQAIAINAMSFHDYFYIAGLAKNPNSTTTYASIHIVN